MPVMRHLAEPHQPAWPARGYAWFVVALLSVAFVLAYVDRYVMAILAESVKQSLSLSDSEVGLIIGLAFSVSYALAAIPAGRIVDAGSRRRMILIGLTAWSCLTAVCGLASGFVSLFAARALVGIGEATIFPAASSLIGDYFPPKTRMRAVTVFIFGASLGSALAYILGGVLLKALTPYAGHVLPVVGALQPWQMVFFLLGGLGLLIAPAMLLIREPERRDVGGAAEHKPQFKAVLAFLFSEGRGLLALIVGLSIMMLLVSGMIAWLPSLFSRRFAWPVEKTGAVVGGIALSTGIIGSILANVVAERFAKRNAADAIPRAALWFCVICAVPMVVCALMPTGEQVAMVLFPALMLAMGLTPFMQGAIQLAAPNRMRGQVTGIYVLIASLFSSALGPSLIAFFTDVVFRDEAKLHYSLALAGAVTIPPALLLLVYSRKRFATLMP